MMLQARPATVWAASQSTQAAPAREPRGRRAVPQARTRCWEGIVAPRGSNRGKLWRPRGLLIAVRDGVSQPLLTLDLVIMHRDRVRLVIRLMSGRTRLDLAIGHRYRDWRNDH